MPNKKLKILFYDRKTEEKNWGTERLFFLFCPFFLFSVFSFHFSFFIFILLRARLPIDGRLATGDGADR